MMYGSKVTHEQIEEGQPLNNAQLQAHEKKIWAWRAVSALGCCVACELVLALGGVWAFRQQLTRSWWAHLVYSLIKPGLAWFLAVAICRLALPEDSLECWHPGQRGLVIFLTLAGAAYPLATFISLVVNRLLRAASAYVDDARWTLRFLGIFITLPALISIAAWLLSLRSVAVWAPNADTMMMLGGSEFLFGASDYEYSHMESGFAWTSTPRDQLGGLVWSMLAGDPPVDYDVGYSGFGVTGRTNTAPFAAVVIRLDAMAIVFSIPVLWLGIRHFIKSGNGG